MYNMKSLTETINEARIDETRMVSTKKMFKNTVEDKILFATDQLDKEDNQNRRKQLERQIAELDEMLESKTVIFRSSYSEQIPPYANTPDFNQSTPSIRDTKVFDRMITDLTKAISKHKSSYKNGGVNVRVNDVVGRMSSSGDKAVTVYINKNIVDNYLTIVNDSLAVLYAYELREPGQSYWGYDTAKVGSDVQCFNYDKLDGRRTFGITTNDHAYSRYSTAQSEAMNDDIRSKL